MITAMSVYTTHNKALGCEPIRAVCPSDARVRVGIEVAAVVELLLGRLLELFRVNGEAGHYNDISVR